MTASAFPVPGFPHADFDGYGFIVEPKPGLTKRELIAAMAMQGLLASPDTTGATFDGIAADSVRYADELLSALADPDGAA